MHGRPSRRVSRGNGRRSPAFSTALPLALLLAAAPLDAQAAPSVGTMDGETARSWIAALREGSGPALARAQRGFAKAGAQAGSSSVAGLADLLHDARPHVRAGAAAALGSLGPTARDALPALVAALADSAADVRAEVAWALGRVARDAAHDLPTALAERLTDPSPLVATRARQAVYGFRVPTSFLPRTEALLNATTPAAQDAGFALLRRLTDASTAVTRLTALLERADARVRVLAAESLYELGPTAAPALGRLKTLRQDPDSDVREAVTDAIGEIERAAEARPQSGVGDARTASAPLACDHRAVERQILTTLTVVRDSRSLRDDGRGAYRQQFGALSWQNYAYSLRLPYTGGADERARRDAEASAAREPARWLTVDLTAQLPSSGARALGVARDSAAQFHTFHLLGADRVIRNLRDIPVGATVASDRTELQFHVDGVLHHLQLGPWALGQCGEGYTNGGVLHGEGTTAVRITRTSERDYLVEAPEGSVARLWDIGRIATPVDRGLYRVSFRVRLEQQP